MITHVQYKACNIHSDVYYITIENSKADQVCLGELQGESLIIKGLWIDGYYLLQG